MEKILKKRAKKFAKKFKKICNEMASEQQKQIDNTWAKLEYPPKAKDDTQFTEQELRSRGGFGRGTAH